jgi:predicted choloylglycine hydrolase
MHVTFRAIEEFRPGVKWASQFSRLWPAYESWFLKEGDAARPGYLTCVSALREHMPELLPAYESLVDLAGGGDQAARLLSLYCPTPYLTGCSQAVWTRDSPLLIRNYDYSPGLWEAVLLHTAWSGRRVIAMSDCLWGVIDGMNESGLAVSLAFGGRKVVGRGFGIPLVLRYVLEFCHTTAQAAAVLERVPTHMAYNVTLLDAAGEFATVMVAPDRPATVTRRPVATNHQNNIEWAEFVHATSSLDRERLLANHLNAPGESPEQYIQRFLLPPLFSRRFDSGWGTLFTAVYDPQRGSASYRWPSQTCVQTFERFAEQEFDIHFT